MSVRTTEAAVRTLLHQDYDVKNKPSLLVHVQSASFVVDDVVEAAADEGTNFPAARQELCERYLACWFYTCVDPMYSQRSTLSASGAFLRGKDEYLTRAEALDPTGQMESILNGRTAGFSWGGLPTTQQTEYHDRGNY